jgi:hypothetical protein
MSISVKTGVNMAIMILMFAFPGITPGEPLSSIKDVTPEWYFPEWLGSSPHAPSFQVRDTTNKYGRYAQMTKSITLKDLIKFHGHFCGGLVESAGALRVAFDRLFPDGVIDRTDLRIVSNNSACSGDVAAYLTGGRLRFATLDVRHATLQERNERGSLLRFQVFLEGQGEPQHLFFQLPLEGAHLFDFHLNGRPGRRTLFDHFKQFKSFLGQFRPQVPHPTAMFGDQAPQSLFLSRLQIKGPPHFPEGL